MNAGWLKSYPQDNTMIYNKNPDLSTGYPQTYPQPFVGFKSYPQVMHKRFKKSMIPSPRKDATIRK